MNIPVLPTTNVVDAVFQAFRIGRSIQTIDGRVYMVPGRNTAQVIKALKARELVKVAAELRANQ